MKNLTGESMNITEENLKAMQQLFPEAFEEGKIDFDVLRQLLGDFVDDEQERYSFKWNGKGKALRLSQTPSMGTLRPCKEESKDWDNTENLYIEGDNLEVLKLLTKSYYKKVKLIYIDPPYNTGNNLIYHNDFTQTIKGYLVNSGQLDAERHLLKNPETNGRFHTDWLNMMYPRLRLAKTLLATNGVLVVAIDENEMDTLSLMLKDIFGQGGYEHVCVTVVHNPRGQQGKNFSHTNEYAIFVFPKGEKIIADALIKEDDVDWSQFRNWGSESERSDAKNCFYPVMVKEDKIIGFGNVCKDDFHPKQTEFRDGVFYVYPIDKQGVERKWRYAIQSVDMIKNMLRAKKTKCGYEIEIGKTFGRQKTVWSDHRYDANEYGTRLIGELVPNNGFSFPKSLWTVYDTIYSATTDEKSAIVLDFFSGSATTAHAVMQLNAEDGGHRKFIMVQLPEPTDKKSEAYKAGYKNICEIGKERIRRAGEKIKAEAGDKAANLDIGFKVFKLDSSNLQKWNPQPDDLVMTLQQATDNFLPDRTEQDVLYEIMLKMGLDLTCQIEEEQAAGETVYIIGGGALMICLGRNITTAVAEAVVKLHEEYESELWQVVFRDTGFASDMDKTNVKETLKAAGLDEDSFVCV